ncbi:MAG: HD domain-containing protein [Desulfobacterales bacterium]|nr:HD domain-containing protein [Desulfobacterales bacterium]
MNDRDLQRFRDWFQHYTDSFLAGDDRYDGPIRLKIDHTFRVCRNIRALGRSLDLPAGPMREAETAALFHDLGRFRQYRDYGTFLDSASANHARLSLLEMGRHRVLAPCSTEEKRRIAGAIAAHNAFAVPGSLTPDRRRLMLLLRDADKLDIWKVVTEYYERRRAGKQKESVIELDLPDDDTCSAAVLNCLCREQMVKMTDIHTLNDFKLLQIGWVYDLNFPETFRMLQKEGFIEGIAATLPRTRAVREAVETALAYAAGKVSDNGGRKDRMSEVRSRERKMTGDG